MAVYDEKIKTLENMIASFATESCAVAFSGGVDSAVVLSLLCTAAKTHGTSVYAVTMQTKLNPTSEIGHAAAVAAELGAAHIVIEIDELSEAGIEDNPTDRCYRCKRALFEKMRSHMDVMGAKTLLDGTNADDLQEYRPGLRALKELGIISPLADVGFTKNDVRRLAAERRISVADRASSPCLATRFPYGTFLSYEALDLVERGEQLVRGLGFYNVRLRIYGNLVRLEVDEWDLPHAVEHRVEITEGLKKLGYQYVTLDLEGFRSGSMDLAYMNKCR